MRASENVAGGEQDPDDGAMLKALKYRQKTAAGELPKKIITRR